MKILLTGASGFVGRLVAEALKELISENLDLVEVSRSHSERTFQLGESIDLRNQNFDMVINCAYDFKQTTLERSLTVNLEGTKKLLENSKAANIPKFIQISSHSAHQESLSIYGLTKQAVDDYLKTEEGTRIFRLGVVTSDTSEGFIGAIDRVANKFPVVPVPNANSILLYETPYSSLKYALELEINNLLGDKCYNVGKAKIYTLGDFIKMRNPGQIVISIPASLAYRAFRFGEFLFKNFPFRSDSILSIIAQAPLKQYEFIG